VAEVTSIVIVGIDFRVRSPLWFFTFAFFRKKKKTPLLDTPIREVPIRESE
jgi:hypothetical protein